MKIHEINELRDEVLQSVIDVNEVTLVLRLIADYGDRLDKNHQEYLINCREDVIDVLCQYVGEISFNVGHYVEAVNSFIRCSGAVGSIAETSAP